MTARKLAEALHRGQRPDRDGRPHFDHVLRVAGDVSPDALDAAYLHDTLEDTRATAESLREYGVDEATVRIVEHLTRQPGETYRTYIDRLASVEGREGDLAREVKVADLRDNIRRCQHAGERSLLSRYEPALRRIAAAAR